MRMHARYLAFLLAAVCVLGLPPVLLLSGAPTSDAPDQDPLHELIAEQSTLADRYQQWQAAWVEGGGDSFVQMRLGWALGLSKVEQTRARGELQLDLLAGDVEARVTGLDDDADLWLVDNQEFEGHSAAPQKGDRMVRLGRLVPEADAVTLRAELGSRFFEDFMVDLAVVTRAGESPVEGGVLFGSRSLFERIYTRQRMIAAREARENGLLKSLTREGIAELLSPRPAHANSSSILVAKGLVSQMVADGGDLFFRGTFQGNGRTCGTCHPVQNNQTIDVPFIQTLPDSDKLFVADHDPANGGVPGLETPNLRHHALVLENIDGAEDPTVKFTQRGVPHSLSMGTSVTAPDDGRAPVERTGWSGDGAPVTGALRFFTMGAVFQHFTKSLDRIEGTDFVFPTDAEADAVEAFMRAVGRVEDPNNPFTLTGMSLTNAGAERGRNLFLNLPCNGCHNNATANTGAGTNNNFDTGVESLSNPAQNTFSFPADGGFGTELRDCDGDGEVGDCFGDGTFNTVGLIEIADTPPFFHNNVIQTVEGSVAFYAGPEFGNSPSGGFLGGPIQMSSQDIDDIAAMLRVINAAFNIDIAIQRVAGARTLENSSGGIFSSTASTEDADGTRATANTLLALANIEAADAVEVLDARSLNPDVVQDLMDGISDAEAAIAESSSKKRASLMDAARKHFETGRSKLGTGINYTMGEGNLMF